MDNHAATQHEFTRKCLQMYTEDLSQETLEELEEDLPEYAETVLHGGGYDLDKRLAALQAENERLRAALKPFARIAGLSGFPKGINVTLWERKTNEEGKDGIAITLADCAEARRVLGEPPAT